MAAPQPSLEGRPTLDSMDSDTSDIRVEKEIQMHGNNQLASNSYQKMIEQKEKELRTSIMANYSRIKEVERELAELQIQLQVNVGPRKHALELLRNKIERQNEKVSKLRVKQTAAKKALDSIEEELKREEEAKDKLCAELGLLVQQSATAQLAKLEELKNQLELMNRGMPVPHHNPHTAGPAPPTQYSDSSTATTQPHPQQPNGSTSHTQHNTQQPASQSGSATAASESTHAQGPASKESGQDAGSHSSGAAGGGGASAANKAGRGTRPSTTTANAQSASMGPSATTDTMSDSPARDPTEQKLLAEVAAARAARQSAAASGSVDAVPTWSEGGVMSSVLSSQGRRAPAGASLMPQRASQSSSAGDARPAVSARTDGKFAGFDV